MNRDQHIADQLNDFCKANLAGWNVLKTFAPEKYESYKTPFVYVFDPVEAAEYPETYEDHDSVDYDIRKAITCYIGFSAQNDLAGAGKFDIAAREHAAIIERKLRMVIVDDYKDEFETCTFQGMAFKGKSNIAANDNFSKGLSVVEFEIKGKVTPRD